VCHKGFAESPLQHDQAVGAVVALLQGEPDIGYIGIDVTQIVKPGDKTFSQNSERT